MFAVIIECLLVACLFGLIGAAIGGTKGRPAAGFFFGFLIGPIGWIIVAVGPNERSSNTDDLLMGEPSPAPRTSIHNPAESLLALKRVLDAGGISKEEYDRKKNELLGQIGEPVGKPFQKQSRTSDYRIPGIND